jgi:hypothetical protein
MESTRRATLTASFSIIPKLPALIENKREELLERDLEQFVASIMPSDPMRDVLLDIEFDNVAMREHFMKSHKYFDSKTIAKNAGYKTPAATQIPPPVAGSNSPTLSTRKGA